MSRRNQVHLVQAGNREKGEEPRWVEEYDAKVEVSRYLKAPQRAEGERVEGSRFLTADDERGNRMMQVKRPAECWREPNTQGDTDKMEDARCPPPQTRLTG